MPYWAAMGLVFVALIIEHLLCRSTDLARINVAFFQMNALVGLILVIGVGASIFWQWNQVWERELMAMARNQSGQADELHGYGTTWR